MLPVVKLGNIRPCPSTSIYFALLSLQNSREPDILQIHFKRLKQRLTDYFNTFSHIYCISVPRFSSSRRNACHIICMYVCIGLIFIYAFISLSLCFILLAFQNFLLNNNVYTYMQYIFWLPTSSTMSVHCYECM